MAGIEDAVRPAQLPPAAPGYRNRALGTSNAATPATSFGDRGGQTDRGPYARVDEPEDYKRWPRLNMLLTGGQEISSGWKNVSSSFRINPNAASIWRLSCQSQSLAISFDDLDALPEGIAQTIWEDAVRVATIQIVVRWLVAASGSRTLGLFGVKFEDSDTPAWTTTAGEDVLVVQIWSDGEKRGYKMATNTGVPA